MTAIIYIYILKLFYLFGLLKFVIMDELKNAKVKRKFIRTAITKACDKVTSEISTLDLPQLDLYQAKIGELQAKVKEVDDEVFTGLIDTNALEPDLQREYNTSEEYSDKLIEALNLVQNASFALRNPVQPFVQNAATPQHATRIKLPDIPMPSFGNNEGENLHDFFENLETILGDYPGLTAFQKMSFLKGQLSGEPLSLVSGLNVKRQKYEIAKELLKRAFASNISQQYHSIKRLCELKFNPKLPYEYVGKLDQIKESFTTLKITTDIVMQYFFWNSMPEGLQNQFITMSNKNRPSLDDIDTHIFDAIERYSDISKRKSPKQEMIPEVNNLAISMNKFKSTAGDKPHFCSLCSSNGNKVTSHSSYSCTVYPTVEDKLARIRDVRGCEKCSNTTHVTGDCKFRFKNRCMNCQKYHFSYLCPDKIEKKSNGNNKPQQKGKNSKNVNTCCVWVAEATLDRSGQDSMMPTFTCNFGGTVVRVLRDSGAQACLIEQQLADQLGLKIVQHDLNMNLHGFNSSSNVQTTVVELQLSADAPPIHLTCVPKIRTKMMLPGLKSVVSAFVRKGYTLADKLLEGTEEVVENIGIILGNSESQVLPQTDVTFGPAPSSMFAESPRGIMLMGSVERMITNLKYLPDITGGAEVSMLSCVSNSAHLPVLSPTPTSEPTLDVWKTGGGVDESVLQQALAAAMKQQLDAVLPYENDQFNDNVAEIDRTLVQFVLENTTRAGDTGRIIMPLMWNADGASRISNNFALSKAILNSNFKKYKNSKDKLLLYDSVLKEQESLGVIEKIGNIRDYMREHPFCSFLGHMGVFKMDNDTTKCRVVYLANLADRRSKPDAISHCQALFPGPCLNKRLATTICDWRFDRYILCYDIVKAFLSVMLREIDQEKLLLLWYRNVEKGDFTLQGYRHVRLPFGLPCSPCILSLSLYYILMMNGEDDSLELREMKNLLYSLLYVDNGAYTTNDVDKLHWAFEQLESIFGKFKFKLQQFQTNVPELQARIDAVGEETPAVVKFFGLAWNRIEDTLSTGLLTLDPRAVTKRSILSSIASNYDLFQICGPMLNRARIFMHALQCDKDVGWDSKLTELQMRTWANICNQLNNKPAISIPRFVGRRDGSYRLIACTDASKIMYGCVLYIEDCATGRKSFLLAKNRIVSKQLESKTIPCLEFQAMCLGVEVLTNLHEELSGPNSVTPINIEALIVLSDSAISLNWLNNAYHKLDKAQKLSIFVRNRLTKILDLCQKKEIHFKHVGGSVNPGDAITRCLSYKQLMDTCYHSGPDLQAVEASVAGGLSFVVPRHTEDFCESTVLAIGTEDIPCVLDLDRYSTLEKATRAVKTVLSYINKLKLRVNKRKGWNMTVQNRVAIHLNAWNYLVKSHQRVNFKDIVEFFGKKNVPNCAVPNLISQLNLYLDAAGIIRVKSKFDRWSVHGKYQHPILLQKYAKLTNLIIDSAHRRKGHAGCYSVLTELRRLFYVPCHFSVVKKVLKACTLCRRVNARPIKLTQNAYRDFRVTPANIPYRHVYVDYFGSYNVKSNGSRVKVWVLLITCMWSRAINLKVCTDMTVGQFLRAFQTHIFEFGTPELVLSDSGSQLVAAGNIISTIVSDPTVAEFLVENGIKPMAFSHYSKGCTDLGGAVESCVKISKRMLHGTIRAQVLDLSDFTFMVAQAVCLANKRPVAFKEALRDPGISEDLPSPITPEVLLRGHDLVTLNILPSQSVDMDPDWTPVADRDAHVKQSCARLNLNRQNMIKLYQEEFLADLTRQATNVPGRYSKIGHDKLSQGDLVLLKEQYLKSINFPMGRVIEVVENSLGEITDAVILKGNGEKVRRHVRSLVLLLKGQGHTESDCAKMSNGPNMQVDAQAIPDMAPVDAQAIPDMAPVDAQAIPDMAPVDAQAIPSQRKSKRKAAMRCSERLSAMTNADLI